MHPYLVQPKLLEFCQSLGIQVVAYSPLGSASYVELGEYTNMNQLFYNLIVSIYFYHNNAKIGAVISKGDSVIEQKIVQDIAKAHQKSPAQIALRWGVQRGCVVITKSSQMERLKENFAIFDFELSETEVDVI
jgi:D-xylose reductase